METLKLFPYQEEHVSIIKETLNKLPFALDLSMLGTGKTYTTSKIALDLKFKHVVVIAPVSVLPKWNYMKKEYGIPITTMISFCGLRSIKDKQPKHGLLIREDYTETYTKKGVEYTVEKVKFSPTKQYLRMVKEGVLIVMDEIQNVKNISSQFEAARSLYLPISESKKSKAIFLSGSPIDKEVQAVHLFKCLNIFQSKELCNYHVYNGTYDYAGLEEITRFCMNISSEPLPPKNYYSNKTCISYVYTLFQKVLKPYCSHAMPPPKLDISLSKYNGFYNIENMSDKVLLGEGIDMLADACKYNPENKTVEYHRNAVQSFTKITSSLMMIERAKMQTFTRLVQTELSNSKNGKIVVCLNYTENILKLKEALDAYNPLTLQGYMTQKQRDVAISRFQQKNSKYRVLIANLTVCSTGIDLDDKHGSYPRVCYISPMFNTITLYQLGHRFQRMDTKSSASIYMVYGEGYTESNIMAALMRKGQIMKDTVKEQTEAGVEFPGDYKEYYEE